MKDSIPSVKKLYIKKKSLVTSTVQCVKLMFSPALLQLWVSVFLIMRTGLLWCKEETIDALREQTWQVKPQVLIMS